MELKKKKKRYPHTVKEVCPNCQGKKRLEVKLWSNISEGHDCYAPVMCIRCHGTGYINRKEAK